MEVGSDGAFDVSSTPPAPAAKKQEKDSSKKKGEDQEEDEDEEEVKARKLCVVFRNTNIYSLLFSTFYLHDLSPHMTPS